LADQQEFCFYLTIGSIALPLVLLILFSSLILFLLPPLVDLFVALVILVTTNPVWEAIVNGGESQGYFEIPGEGEAPNLGGEGGNDDNDDDDDYNDYDDELEFNADKINRRLVARKNATLMDTLTSGVAYLLMRKQKKE
jgi:hypothetical protein